MTSNGFSIADPVEVIARDRFSAYAEGASAGAPEAETVFKSENCCERHRYCTPPQATRTVGRPGTVPPFAIVAGPYGLCIQPMRPLFRTDFIRLIRTLFPPITFQAGLFSRSLS